MPSRKTTVIFYLIGLAYAFGFAKVEVRAWDWADFWSDEQTWIVLGVMPFMFVPIPWIWWGLKCVWEWVSTHFTEKTQHKRLFELKQLKDEGLYTDAEYAAAIAKIKGTSAV